MVVTSDKIREKFSDVNNLWLRNTKYILPTIEELKEAISRFSYKDLPIIPGFNECENFALFLHSDIKKYGVKDNQKYNWAFGDFICKKQTTLQGLAVHSACLCVCQDNIYVIEPMYDNLISVLDKDKYQIFFINMN